MANIVFLKFPLVDTLGGAEFHTQKLARHFVSQGHLISLFSSDKKLLGLFESRGLANKQIFMGWEPTSKRALLLWPLTWWLAQFKLKRLLPHIPRGSIFFMQSLTEKLILTPLLLDESNRLQSKIIWLEHKIPGRWLKLNPLLGQYLELATQVRVVTVSNFAKEKFVNLGVPEKNVNVIYPGISITPSQPPPHGEEKKEGITVGVLGRLDPEKGVLDFLKTILPHLHSHPKWKILIAGQGKEETEIIRIINKNNLGQRVKLLGFVHNLDEFFSQISVLAYPSKAAESFGMSIIETLARGIPIIATKLGAIPEIVEHGKNGFLIERGKNSWMKYWEKLANPGLYQKFSIAALGSAKRFSETDFFANFDHLIS